jgi:hypothetical protein
VNEVTHLNEPKRLAMWSGPRNLSTAMMYAFAQRDDCEVWDEPFYAAYLSTTGIEHPLGDAIVAAGDIDPKTVTQKCCLSGPENKPLFYQKHMTQHMIPEFDRAWVLEQHNVFLIRHPARVLASYAAKRDNPTLNDIGFIQQMELIDLLITETGQAPLIVDSADIRNNPEAMLTAICAQVGIPFYAEMLTWAKGGNSQDGAWAPHWYSAVWNSSGFAGPEKSMPNVADSMQDVYQPAKRIYDRMSEMKLRL